MDDERSRRAGGEQAALWSGAGGRGWVAVQALTDALFQPIDDVLLDGVAPGSARRVLDIGCGTGATTVAVARRLGPRGRCVGIDLSEAMIAAARARPASDGGAVDYVVADAQTHAFAGERFDALVSRFGVMFFSDPVAAFVNLRRAATAGAALRCVVWRGADENPFMTTAEWAAAPLLPNLPTRHPDGPGQFAFADGDRVREILAASGWSAIDLQPVDVACAMPEPDLVRYLVQLGPVGRALQGADDGLVARVVAAVRPAFERYVNGAEVRFTAACWVLTARA